MSDCPRNPELTFDYPEAHPWIWSGLYGADDRTYDVIDVISIASSMFLLSQEPEGEDHPLFESYKQLLNLEMDTYADCQEFVFKLGSLLYLDVHHYQSPFVCRIIQKHTPYFQDI